MLDEIVLHQVPVLLGGGTPSSKGCRPRFNPGGSVVENPGVTHLTFAVVR